MRSNFDQAILRARRDRLRRALGSGIAVFPGNGELPRTFAGDSYPFRQDSNVLYFFGVTPPGVVGVIDADAGTDRLYVDPPGPDEQIWQDTSCWNELCAAGAAPTGSIAELGSELQRSRRKRRAIHFLLPARADVLNQLAAYVGIGSAELSAGASSQLRRIVVAMREIKSADEVRDIEAALDVTASMQRIAMSMARPGVRERSIVAHMQAAATDQGMCLAYQPICTTHGDVLHNLSHDNVLMEGDLLLVDIGAETQRGYASDITRTTPVGGRFSAVQAELYDAVYRAQQSVIDLLRPGVPYRDAHRAASAVMSQALADLGIVRGSVDDFVESAGYGICFPHGLGHAMGLDVHDMEALGEEHVGYDTQYRRDARFGPNHLRFGKELREGMVITVEPGLYFIAPLIERWQAAGKFSGIIDYEQLKLLIGFGGIRIEDDVLITATGCRILGPKMPRSRAEVSAAYGQPQGPMMCNTHPPLF
jgi:Xaa-Pro aminopeptidase